MTMLCQRCRLGPLADDDRHCFVCGVPLRDVRIELHKTQVTIPADSDKPQSVDATARNKGQFGAVAQVPLPHPWLALFHADVDEPVTEPWHLAPGAAMKFQIRVAPDGARFDGKVVVPLAPVDEEGKPVGNPATLSVYPAQQVRVELDTGAVVDMAQTVNPELRATIHLLPHGASPVSNLRLGDAVNWATIVKDGNGWGIVVDLARLREDRAVAWKSSAGLRLQVDLDDRDDPVDVTLEVPLRWPAELNTSIVKGGDSRQPGEEWELAAGRLHVLGLKLGNRGGSTLTVHDIQLDSSNVPVSFDSSYKSGTVLTINPSQSITLPLVIDLREFRDKFTADLCIRTSAANRDPERIEIPIRPFTRAPYEGAAGFDFGTSNSCLVTWARDGAEPVPAEYAPPFVTKVNGHRQGAVASAILYQRHFHGGERDRQIGNEEVADKELDFLIHSAKRHLGDAEPVSVAFVQQGISRSLDVREVVGDTVQSLLWAAEDALGKTIERCVLTHPVRFSTRQIRHLREMLGSFGVKVELLLAEPVAAAIDFTVAHPERESKPPDYDLLVLDVGGGTTDIALLHVRDFITEAETDSPTRVIRPELLAVNGNRWAGGDDITWEVLRRFLASGDDQVVSMTLGLPENEIPAVRAAVASGDPEAAWSNKAVNAAFLKADIAKQTWSTAAGGGGDETDLEPWMRQILPDKEALEDIADAFYHDSGLESMIRVVLGSRNDPDDILLVGRTWRLARLRRHVEVAFPLSTIHPKDDGEFKLPVARGACRAHQFHKPEVQFELDLSKLKSFATARIGTLSLDLKTGRNTFREAIAGEDHGNVWHRVTTRLAPGQRLDIYENTGYTDELSIDRETRPQNPEIRKIAVVELPPESDDAWRQGSSPVVEVRLTDAHGIEARIIIGGKPRPLKCEPA